MRTQTAGLMAVMGATPVDPLVSFGRNSIIVQTLEAMDRAQQSVAGQALLARLSAQEISKDEYNVLFGDLLTDIQAHDSE